MPNSEEIPPTIEMHINQPTGPVIGVSNVDKQFNIFVPVYLQVTGVSLSASEIESLRSQFASLHSQIAAIPPPPAPALPAAPVTDSLWLAAFAALHGCPAGIAEECLNNLQRKIGGAVPDEAWRKQQEITSEYKDLPDGTEARFLRVQYHENTNSYWKEAWQKHSELRGKMLEWVAWLGTKRELEILLNAGFVAAFLCQFDFEGVRRRVLEPWAQSTKRITYSLADMTLNLAMPSESTQIDAMLNDWYLGDDIALQRASIRAYGGVYGQGHLSLCVTSLYERAKENATKEIACPSLRALFGAGGTASEAVLEGLKTYAGRDSDAIVQRLFIHPLELKDSPLYRYTQQPDALKLQIREALQKLWTPPTQLRHLFDNWQEAADKDAQWKASFEALKNDLRGQSGAWVSFLNRL